MNELLNQVKARINTYTVTDTTGAQTFTVNRSPSSTSFEDFNQAYNDTVYRLSTTPWRSEWQFDMETTGITADRIILDDPTGRAPVVEDAEMPEAKVMVGEIITELTSDAPDTYLEMCRKLGYWPSQFIDKQLDPFCNSFMRKNEFAVYDKQQVELYLKSRCRHAEFKEYEKKGDAARNRWGRNSFQWEWKPLREQDRCERKPNDGKLFAETIPQEALEVVAKVTEAWETQTKGTPMQGVQPHFSASEIYKDPDPFLRVVFARRNSEVSSSFVLFHWDEPGFSVTK